MTDKKQPYPTAGELALIGVAVLDLVGTCMTLGHAKPQHTLDYMHGEPDFSTQVVHDLVAWCSGGKSLNAADREERLRTYVNESGWRRAQHQRAVKAMGLDKISGGDAS